jgi:AraC family transcriptional regulator
MIVQQLPKPHTALRDAAPPVFTDHFLYTERLQQSYYYPEHVSGLGILCVDAGRGHFILNGEKNRVHEKSFLLVGSGSKLSIDLRQAHDAQPAFLFFHSMLPGLVAQSIFTDTEKLLEQPGTVAVTDFSCLERIHSMDASLQRDLALLAATGGSCSSFAALKADIIVRGILEKLIWQNSDALHFSKKLNVTKQSTRVELFKRLSLAKEWMDAHCCYDISLQDMAAVAMLNSHHFLRLFKQCYGTTPYQYLVQQRLEHARDLLQQTQDPVAVVSAAVGFDSISSFNFLFKQRFGLAPSSLRNAISLHK